MVRLEVQIARLLRKYQAATGKLLKIGSAESASGGRIGDKITNVPGSSDYYKGSVVAYSNEIKMNVLGVRAGTLESHGAVSPETAIAMAEGCRKLLNVNVCVSDTGIAGPSGATQGKPVGLFYFGLSATDTALTREHLFTGSREKNKRQATTAALIMLKEYVEERLEEAPLRDPH